MDAKATGKIINSKRKEKGLTQIQLAELLNVSNRTVSKWENGDGFPDITLLPDIADTLGITIDELLTGKKPESVSAIKERRKSGLLMNEFKICFATALFLSAFSALLGCITEIYCIWAFPVLFYTHWEIIFAAVSFVALTAGNLVFIIGLIRLRLEYTKEEILAASAKKGLLVLSLSVLFPLSFIARIIDFSRFTLFTPYIMAILIAATVWILLSGYKRIRNKYTGENHAKS